MPAPPEAFKDHFSGHAALYARYRPDYPPALFAALAALAPARDLAWDCGTGNGQAALGLAEHFAQVVATDASEAQLRQAPPHERVTYRAEPAERTSLPARAVDLVTVAQALHWFSLEAFYEEVQRVLKPGGVLAAWSYHLVSVSPAVDPVLDAYYQDVVGPYWPPERRLVDDGYRSLPFPFAELPAPTVALEKRWTMEDVLGYLASWSATQRFVRAQGTDPIAQVRDALAAAWGDPAEERLVRWPLHFRIGRLPAPGH